MNISEIIPELALKSFLEYNDVTGIYPAGIPISGEREDIDEQTFRTIPCNV